MTKRERAKTVTIESPDQIPTFSTEAEEAEFWRTHSLGEGMLARMEPPPDDLLPPPRARTQPIAVRFDADVLRRLKALAREKNKGYQTLLKEFVVERLYEEEKRMGLVGGDEPSIRPHRR